MKRQRNDEKREEEKEEIRSKKWRQIENMKSKDEGRKEREEAGKAEAHKAIKQCLTFSLFLILICLINKLIPQMQSSL